MSREFIIQPGQNEIFKEASRFVNVDTPFGSATEQRFLADVVPTTRLFLSGGERASKRSSSSLRSIVSRVARERRDGRASRFYHDKPILPMPRERRGSLV